MSKQHGSRSGGPIDSFLRETDVRHLSTALVIATIEFVACTGTLLARSVPGTISHDSAFLWGAVILVPLSFTVGYLGMGVGMAGKRIAIRDRGPAPAPREELPRLAAP